MSFLEFGKQSPQFIAAIIPARGGSKGIPHKNIKLLDGKPLIQYTIEAAKQSKLLSCFFVSTEDLEISSISKKLGSIVIDRPPELAKDETPTMPVILHAINWIEDNYQRKLDYIIILQATTPFRTGTDIDNAIRLIKETKADSVVSVTEVTRFHPMKLKKIINNHIVPYFEKEVEGIRRQDLPSVYIRNGGIYVFTRKVIIQEHSIFGNYCHPYIMPKERSVEIDEEMDFKIAEIMLSNNKST